MSTTDLWDEALGDSLECADCWHLYEQMTPEQRVAAAECLHRWADGFNEFSPLGQGCISDPRDTEMEELRKLLRDERKGRERDAEIYQKHIADRRNVWVSIHPEGFVEVEAAR